MSIGRVSADGIDQVASIGPAVSPTVFITGKCRSDATVCRFWLTLIDNHDKAPDLVAFFISDASGQRLAYGAGPIGQGDISITGNE